MEATEMSALKQVAITTLMTQSHRLTDIGETVRVDPPCGSSRIDSQELGRLEQLGLVAFGATGRRVGDVRLTSAGVEMLAYLASAE